MGLEHLTCQERMGELDLYSLEKEQLLGHLTAAPSTYRAHQEERAGSFIVVYGGWIKAH